MKEPEKKYRVPSAFNVTSDDSLKWKTQDETLQDRLQREAEYNIADTLSECDGGWSNRFQPVLDELKQTISHTISETIKAGVSAIDGEKLWEYDFQGKRSNTNKNWNQALQTAVTKLQELQDKK